MSRALPVAATLGDAGPVRHARPRLLPRHRTCPASGTGSPRVAPAMSETLDGVIQRATSGRVAGPRLDLRLLGHLLEPIALLRPHSPTGPPSGAPTSACEATERNRHYTTRGRARSSARVALSRASVFARPTAGPCDPLGQPLTGGRELGVPVKGRVTSRVLGERGDPRGS